MQRVKVIFILGFGHSGSTLLDLLLDSNSQMMGVGEIEAMQDGSVCSCGKPGRECEVWKDAMGPSPVPNREVYRSKTDFFRNRGLFRSGKTHQPIDEQEFIASTLTTMRTVLERTGKSIIVDSSAQTDRADLLSRSPEIEPIYIHLVRDGRAATWSFVRKYKHLSPFIYMWCTANIKIELFLRRARGKKIFLRYEELVWHPEQELRRLCEAIGVAYEPGMVDFRAHQHHQIEGNRMRFGSDPIRIDEKWRHESPLYLRAVFNALFGWLNLYYKFRASKHH